jgi:hypothetical protein
VLPWQADALLAEHWVHAPASMLPGGWHAGSWGVGHADGAGFGV